MLSIDILSLSPPLRDLSNYGVHSNSSRNPKVTYEENPAGAPVPVPHAMSMQYSRTMRDQIINTVRFSVFKVRESRAGEGSEFLSR